jgi:hypothetical protein
VTGTPLTPQDEAILLLEGRSLVGHTCKVIVLEGDGPSIAELRERVAARVTAVPALTMRLAGDAGGTTWVPDPDFAPGEHVVAAATAPLRAAALREEVGRLFTQRLDRARPLWQMDLIPLESGGAALVWRLHHTLADGVTAMRYARALLWDEQPVAGEGSTGASTHAQDEHRRRAHLARFFAREFGRTRSPLDGQVGQRRDVAFARLPLQALHDAARQLTGATLNDALVSAVGGGLRSWLESRHGEIASVRVKVPVSLHHEGEDLGNADSFFIVGVPLAHADPVQRLRAVGAATATRKAQHDAETMDRLLRDLRGVSPRMARFCEQVERSSRAFALNVSNVPGPREPVAVLGAPVRSLHSIAELAEHHAVRVAAVSMCDGLFLGFCADPAIVPGVGSMAEATEREAAELIAAA